MSFYPLYSFLGRVFCVGSQKRYVLRCVGVASSHPPPRHNGHGHPAGKFHYRDPRTGSWDSWVRSSLHLPTGLSPIVFFGSSKYVVRVAARRVCRLTRPGRRAPPSHPTQSLTSLPFDSSYTPPAQTLSGAQGTPCPFRTRMNRALPLGFTVELRPPRGETGAGLPRSATARSDTAGAFSGAASGNVRARHEP